MLESNFVKICTQANYGVAIMKELDSVFIQDGE